MASAMPDLRLPSQPPLDRYQIILLGTRVWTTCSRLLRENRTTGSRTRDLSSRKSSALTMTPPGHRRVMHRPDTDVLYSHKCRLWKRKRHSTKGHIIKNWIRIIYNYIGQLEDSITRAQPQASSPPGTRGTYPQQYLVSRGRSNLYPRQSLSSFCRRMLNARQLTSSAVWTRCGASINSNKDTKTVSINDNCRHFRVNFRLNL